MSDQNIISLFGSHNAAVAVAIEGELAEVIEIERFINEKNASLSWYKIHPNKEIVVDAVSNYLSRKYEIDHWDLCLHQRSEGLEKRIEATQYKETQHHESHAAGSFYQSQFEQAVVVSFDGGGNDGFFNIYNADRRLGISLLKQVNLDLGVPYSLIGHYMEPIKPESDILNGNIVYPGKIMGLSAFGDVQSEWIENIRNFFFDQSRFENYEAKCFKLIEDCKIQFVDRRIGKFDSANLATTFQFVFEEIFLEQISDLIPSTSNLIITGGCALNILLNTRLSKLFNNLFVAPNSSDCGIATGMILSELKPVQPVDVTYLGSEVWDQNTIGEYVATYNSIKIDFGQIANDLSDGHILGIVRNGSEHGPRALGNRSIICNPLIQDMKDVLNAKVKNREYYRPFAPVCIAEEASEYFEIEGESRWMNFAIQIREKYKNVLKPIVHFDGTCRLQTVTKEQNPFLYELLVACKKVTGYPILLNTSFNIAGKPILNSYKDAIWMMEHTQMDGLILGDYFIKKAKV